MAENIRQKKTADLFSILKSGLFSNLLPGEKQSVIEASGSAELRKGELLFSPGKKAERFYFLKKGRIRVFRISETSGEEEIAFFTSGDIVGDFDFARGAEYDAFAEALEDSLLIVFPFAGNSLETMTGETPNVVSRILLNSVAIVTGRIKETRKLITESMPWVQEMHRKIYEDPGTGLWKRSFLLEEIYKYMEDPMVLILLKPDRFKVLVDACGHDAGDNAMVKIASLLKGITRRLGRGWAIRFRSNETGILISKCNASQAEPLALSLAVALSDLHPIPLGNDQGDFSFTGSIVWGVWQEDDKSWDSFFRGNYELLMETWKAGGNKVVRYKRKERSS
jgi:diguanylate cyclase (GGDEF)-like protein